MLLESIYQLNKENPEKSEILIQGYGRMALDTAKKSAIKRLEKAISFIKNSDEPRAWQSARHLIYTSGVVEAMLNAIQEANEELEEIQGNEVEGK